MSGGLPPQVFFLISLALVGGLMAFVRGFVAYRRSVRVTSIEASSVAELTVGEVRLTGTIEPLASPLVSPLQSKPAVWYRSSILDGGRDGTAVLREERAVPFSLRDETGAVLVVPRDANWVVPAAFSESTARGAAEPSGLQRRDDATEAALAMAPTAAELMPADANAPTPRVVQPPSLASRLQAIFGAGREYEEARLEPGQTATVVGYVMPRSEIPVDEVAADGAAEGAVDAGLVPSEQLVISAEPGGRLVVYAGDPSKARGRHDQNFLLGLGGAITASVAAYALIVLVNGSM